MTGHTTIHIHPFRKVDYIFFSYHCDISSKLKKGTKDLSLLVDIFKLPGYTQDNVFILDDYDEVYNTQPKNCIAVKPFEYFKEGSEQDDFLPKLTEKLQACLGKKVQDCVTEVNESLKGEPQGHNKPEEVSGSQGNTTPKPRVEDPKNDEIKDKEGETKPAA